MNVTRFPAYAEELREFSAGHGVACGTPEDLGGLVAALDAGGEFVEECACMLRSVIYRERGEADAGSLLMLVTGVWGGLTEPEAAMLARLRQFVRGAMRVPQLEEAEFFVEDVASAEPASERIAGVEAGGGEWVAAVPQRALSALEIEGALRELEAGSADVRVYRELLNQRDAAMAAERMGSEAVRTEGVAVGTGAGSGSAFANGFDPWDESSELQQELRRFAEHRERMLALEAEEASRSLRGKLLGGAGSALVHLLGRDRAVRGRLGLGSQSQ